MWELLRKRGSASERKDVPRLYYPFFVGPDYIRVPAVEWNDESEEWVLKEAPQDNEMVAYPIDEKGVERRWRWSLEHSQQSISDLKAVKSTDGSITIYYKYRPPEGVLPTTTWIDAKYSATEHGTNVLKGFFTEYDPFSFPKSICAVEDCIFVAGMKEPDTICIDFFAGSGTTAHAVMNLNREDGGRRKYILVEMADYFYDVLLPRIKKVAFSDEWKDGVAQEDGQGMSHFVKYYELEQYEDVLRKARYGAEGEPFDNPYEDVYQQYVFLRDLKMLHALEIEHEANDVHVDLSTLYDDIDVAETLANRRGKWIRCITPDYVEFEDGERIDLQNLDWQLIKPLIWW